MSIIWDEHFGLPIPPVDTVSNLTVDFWATVIYSTLSLCALAYGLHYWRKTGEPIIVLMLIGGALCSTVEPFVNVMGAVWHPEINQRTVFEIMGRGMPPFLVTGYIFYFGALGSLAYLSFRKGISTRQFYFWAAVPMVVDVAMEELMLYWDLYYYYGEQPLMFIKLPLWWVPCNALGNLIAVCVLLKIVPLLKGWQWLLIPIVIPMADAAAYAAISLPSWIVVNSDVPWLVKQLGGLATFGLAFIVLYGLAQVIPDDSPLARRLSSEVSG